MWSDRCQNFQSIHWYLKKVIIIKLDISYFDGLFFWSQSLYVPWFVHLAFVKQSLCSLASFGPFYRSACTTNIFALSLQLVSFFDNVHFIGNGINGLVLSYGNIKSSACLKTLNQLTYSNSLVTATLTELGNRSFKKSTAQAHQCKKVSLVL